jgi:23S rRNA (guanosine2251-2'-O)-methyltransferase
VNRVSNDDRRGRGGYGRESSPKKVDNRFQKNRKFVNEKVVPNYLYGLNPVFEAIRSGKRQIKSAIISQSSLKNSRIIKLIKVLDLNDIPYETVEKGRLVDVCNSHDHQGVVLFCDKFHYADLEETMQHDRVLLLNNLEDPQNVGAILRSAEIFGFKGVLLPLKGSPEIYPSIVKVSAGATEFLDVNRSAGVTSYLARAKDEGYTIVSLDGRGDSNFLEIKGAAPSKVLLVIGGEDKGVGQFVLNSSDYVAGIKQLGRINSLNASVAAGIAMSALV